MWAGRRSNYLDYSDRECPAGTARIIGERRGGEAGGDPLEDLVSVLITAFKRDRSRRGVDVGVGVGEEESRREV